LALDWGVIPIEIQPVPTIEQTSSQILVQLGAHGLAEPGDVVVMTGRTAVDAPGTTSHVVIHRLAGG
jgi:pyruvate kinase